LKPQPKPFTVTPPPTIAIEVSDRHVANIVAPPSGSPIAMGDPIGDIATGFVAGSRHLHFDVYDSPPPFAHIAAENQYLNPLLRFDVAADRDPLGNKPSIRDTDGDPKNVKVTAGNNNPLVLYERLIGSDVDIIVDSVDLMNSTLGFMTSPHIIGYYVKPLLAGTNGVRTAAAPYILARFNDTWFDGYTDAATGAHVATSSKFNEVYDSHRTASVGTFAWPVLDHYIVTNTKGGTGSIANVDAGQYWNTDAIDTGAPVIADHANYAGWPDAAGNATARFKDGDYEIRIILCDIVNPCENIPARRVRVNNFTQLSRADTGGVLPPGGAPTPIRLAGEAPWQSDIDFAPEYADTSPQFLVGETIGVEGEEFLPNFAMMAYIVPHRENGWMEGDSLAAGAVASAIVESDSDGIVPLTQAWAANQNGEFDAIIDYDNDGLFSSTLDGLSGFMVYDYEPEGVEDHYTFTIPRGPWSVLEEDGVLANDNAGA
jgi:hypothetical protein